MRGYRERMLQAAESRVLDAWYDQLDTERFLAFLDEERKRKQLGGKQVKSADAALAKARTKDSMRAVAKLTEVVDGRLRIAADPPLIVPIEQLDTIGRTYEQEVDVDARRCWRRTRPPSSCSTTRCGSSRTCTWRARWWASAASARGRGSCCVRGRDDADPLLLQAKQAEASVLERFLPPSEYDNHGERVVRGQRLMQAASDIFLGWHRQAGFDGVDRDFYIRQLHDWKGAADVDAMVPSGARVYARVCGETLARAHARSGDRVAIASYLGHADRFDQAIAEFARDYGDQNEHDYAAFVAAVQSGRLEAAASV